MLELLLFPMLVFLLLLLQLAAIIALSIVVCAATPAMFTQLLELGTSATYATTLTCARPAKLYPGNILPTILC
jgi:hypothetical protein